MKKIVVLLLTAVMLLSLTACGGNDNTPPSNTDKPTNSGTGSKEDESEVKFVITQYGSNPDYEVYTATIYCPEGAYFDEAEYAEFQTDGYINDFWVYDDVRVYDAYSTVYWSRDIYKEGDELPQGYGIVEQLYFEGKVAPETEAEYPEYEQKVTDLGFKWEDKDVKLIETTYTSAGGYEYSEVFVGVEYAHYFWVVDPATGKVTDGVTAPGLFGFSISGWDITVDQYAWIAGQLFGVDSGRTWALESEEETEAPVVNVDASKLLGTWLQRDSDWDDTFIFNADGTGVVISGPEYPFTYDVNGDILTLTYDDSDQEEFTISVDGDLLTMIDQWGDELLLDKKAEEATETEETADVPAELIGTWTDEAGTETYAFNADGSGYQIYEDNEYSYTYKVSDDRLWISYDGGGEDDFSFYVDGDKLVIMNSWIYIRQ